MICFMCKGGLKPADTIAVDGARYHKSCRTKNVSVGGTTPIAKPSPEADLSLASTDDELSTEEKQKRINNNVIDELEEE